MIGRLSGILLEKNPPQILVDVNGVGYDLEVPMNTFYGLPDIGSQVILQTHLTIREDGHFLYGFANNEERAVFRQLLKVSGIGTRTALSILSGLSVTDLIQVIALQESARLIKIPGIGKKTAERLLLELRDKLGKGLPSPSQEQASRTGTKTSSRDDILGALTALGYNEKEALSTIRSLPQEVSVTEGIRTALKQLSKI